MRLLAPLCAIVFVASCSSAQPLAEKDASSDAVCGCNDSENLDQPGAGNPFSSLWFAFRYVPTCSITVDTIEMWTTATEFGVFVDQNGAPGDASIPATYAQPSTRPGFRVAKVPATHLSAGVPYWVAVQNTAGDITSTTQPRATAGKTSLYASGEPGKWFAPGGELPFIYSVRGTCQ